MALDTISLRAPHDLLKRAEAIAERRNQSDPHSRVRHTRSSVLLEAVSIGLEPLEARLEERPRRRKAAAG
jgi:hypothetical protein